APFGMPKRIDGLPARMACEGAVSQAVADEHRKPAVIVRQSHASPFASCPSFASVKPPTRRDPAEPCAARMSSAASTVPFGVEYTSTQVDSREIAPSPVPDEPADE